MLLRIVVCRMYDTHELKMVGKLMRGIRVEWSGVEKKVDGNTKQIASVKKILKNKKTKKSLRRDMMNR